MVNPRIVESQIESGIVFGLSAALWGDITISGGRVQQTNFNTYRVLRSNEMPELDVHLVESDAAPGGIGETGGGSGGAGDLQCHFRRNRQAVALPADRRPRA